MPALQFLQPKVVAVGGSIRVRAQVPLLAQTVVLEAEAAHVEMPQLPTGGVHRLMSLLRDRSFTGLENPVAWVLEIPLYVPVEEVVQGKMAQVLELLKLALEEWEFIKFL